MAGNNPESNLFSDGAATDSNGSPGSLSDINDLESSFTPLLTISPQAIWPTSDSSSLQLDFPSSVTNTEQTSFWNNDSLPVPPTPQQTSFQQLYLPDQAPQEQQPQLQPAQQSQAHQNTPPPDLFEDMEDDDVMLDDGFDMPVHFPFKPSSPYYRSPAIRTDPAFFSSLLPLTVSPQDAVLNHNEDYPLTYPGLESTKSYYNPDCYSVQQPVQLLEEPETMDEDDDDEDTEYDEVLISSSDDDLDLEDDLYAPLGSSQKVPGLTAFGTQPTQTDETDMTSDLEASSSHSPITRLHKTHESTPEPVIFASDNDDHHQALPASSRNPSSLLHSAVSSHTRQSSLDHDPVLRPKKRVPVGQTGPHRCDLINQGTGKSCNKVFSRPYDLVRHQDTIHAAVRKTFKCELCGEASKTFSRMDALSRHRRVKHSRA